MNAPAAKNLSSKSFLDKFLLKSILTFSLFFPLINLILLIAFLKEYALGILPHSFIICPNQVGLRINLYCPLYLSILTLSKEFPINLLSNFLCHFRVISKNFSKKSLSIILSSTELKHKNLR